MIRKIFMMGILTLILLIGVSGSGVVLGQAISTPSPRGGFPWLIIVAAIMAICIILEIFHFRRSSKGRVPVSPSPGKLRPSWNWEWATEIMTAKRTGGVKEPGSFRQRVELIAKYLLLLLVLAVGIGVRTTHFGSLPPGMNQDEVSIGYEAFALANYGVDRNGHSFPVHLVSWGSGQNALYAYLIMPMVKIFGLSEATTRFGSLFCGILALFLLFLSVRRIAGFGPALLSTFILSVSPWGIMSSRWGLEANILPAVILGGVYLYLLAFDYPWTLSLSFAVFGLSLYSYGTAYFIVPLLVLMLALVYLCTAGDKRQALKNLGYAGLAFGVLLIPLAVFIFINMTSWVQSSVQFWGITVPKLSTTGSRYAQTIFFNIELQGLTGILQQVSQYWVYFYDTVFRHQGPMWSVINRFGNLYPVSNWFFLVGFAFALGEMGAGLWKQKVKALSVMTFWFLLAVLLGVCTETNPNRINVIFIPMAFYTGYGIWLVARGAGLLVSWPFRRPSWQGKIRFTVQTLALVAVMVLYLSLFRSFALFYFNDYPGWVGGHWNESFGEAIRYTERANPDAKKPVVVVENNMAYIYTLFYTRYDPREFVRTVVYPSPGDEFRRVTAFGHYRFQVVETQVEPERSTIYVVPNEKLEFFQEGRPIQRMEYKRFTVLEY